MTPRVRTFPCWLALLVLGVGCSAPKAPKEPDEPLLTYVERTIAARDDQTLPLIVALHGLGDDPESFLTLFDGLDAPARIVAARAPDPYAVGTSWYPIDDKARAASVIRQRAAQLLRLADHVAAHKKTRGRPIVTGFSQGGVLSFALAAIAPERLTAALPIAGMLPTAIAPRSVQPALRIVAFHGVEDPRIPHADAEAAVARFRAAGADVELLSFPRVGHAIPPALHARYLAALRSVLTNTRP